MGWSWDAKMWSYFCASPKEKPLQKKACSRLCKKQIPKKKYRTPERKAVLLKCRDFLGLSQSWENKDTFTEFAIKSPWLDVCCLQNRVEREMKDANWRRRYWSWAISRMIFSESFVTISISMKLSVHYGLRQDTAQIFSGFAVHFVTGFIRRQIPTPIWHDVSIVRSISTQSVTFLTNLPPNTWSNLTHSHIGLRHSKNRTVCLRSQNDPILCLPSGSFWLGLSDLWSGEKTLPLSPFGRINRKR